LVYLDSELNDNGKLQYFFIDKGGNKDYFEFKTEIRFLEDDVEVPVMDVGQIRYYIINAKGHKETYVLTPDRKYRDFFTRVEGYRQRFYYDREKDGKRRYYEMDRKGGITYLPDKALPPVLVKTSALSK